MQGFKQKIGMLAVAGALAVGMAGCETMEEGGMTSSDSASAAQAAAERSARSAAAAQAAAEAAQAAAERAERMFQQSMQK
jgi:hypothetical protein